MTERRPVTDGEIGRVAIRQWELLRRVKEGTLNPEEVSQGFQRIIEGKEIEKEIREILWYCPKCSRLLSEREHIGTDMWIRDKCCFCGFEFNVYINTGKIVFVAATSEEWKQAMLVREQK